MWRRLCVVLEILLLHASQYGNAYNAYYESKPELGYFAVHLPVVTKPSGIQCASACSLIHGCSVISYSRNQKLCKLSRGIGEYVADSAWTTLVLRAQEHGLNGKVNTSVMTSYATGTTKATPEVVTSQPADLVTESSYTTFSDFISTAVGSNPSGSAVINGVESPNPETVKASYSTDITVTSSATGTTKLTPDHRDISMTTADAVTSQAGDMATTTSDTTASVFTNSFTETPPTTVGNGTECPNPSVFTATPSGSCFHVSDAYREMTKATSSCNRHGGHLATISNEVENHEVIAMLHATGSLATNVLIGATGLEMERTWKWVTGEPFSWIGTGPANPDAEADCLAYSYNNSWEWIKVPCTDKLHSVCEKDPK